MASILGVGMMWRGLLRLVRKLRIMCLGFRLGLGLSVWLSQ